MMERHSFDAELEKFFSQSSSEEWKKIAVYETGGKDPFDFLSWQGKDGISFRPYYDAAMEAGHRFPQLRERAVAKKHSWRNLPHVSVSSKQTANRMALDHLMNGADGVLFDTRGVDDADVKALIDNIQWSHCSIAFDLPEKYSARLIEKILEHVRNENDPALLDGSLFWESVPKEIDLSFYFNHCRKLNALGMRVRESAPAAEISDALARGVMAIEHFSARTAPERVFRAIAFSLSADASFLQCVAKFRVLRMLWWQISQAYGLDDYKPDELHIHARSEAIPDKSLGPHENMLKGTFATMAAIIGGCNSITVEGKGTAAFVSRWARNVSPILREESFLDSAVDPLAGSWAIDSITNGIAQEAWKLFQQKSIDHGAS